MKKLTALLTLCILMVIMSIPAFAMDTSETDSGNLIFVTSEEEAIAAGLSKEVIAEIAYLESQKANTPAVLRWTGWKIQTVYVYTEEDHISVGTLNLAVRVSYSVPENDYYPSDYYIEPNLGTNYKLTLNQISTSSNSSTYTQTYKWRVNDNQLETAYAYVDRSEGTVTFDR